VGSGSYRRAVGVDVDVGRQGHTWDRPKLEPLQQAGGEDEEFLFGQGLSEAVALSDTKRYHSLVHNKLSV